jgi:uncharacterized protein
MSARPKPILALLAAIPIAVLGGLIGLGGAEFRLPVLAGPLGYPAKKAVPLNLVISLITLLTALVMRGRTLSLVSVAPFRVPLVAMILGAMIAAFFGTGLVGRLSNERLQQVIFVLLLAIGVALIVESLLPQTFPALVPQQTTWRVGVGLIAGLAIGLVSSLLGVAGGELIIPTLVFAFGADIKTAGTASLLISLPTVLVGVMRYAVKGAIGNRSDLVFTVAPMGVGSVIGALVGGLLVGIISPSILKAGLGIILIVSAIKIFHHSKTVSVQELNQEQESG